MQIEVREERPEDIDTIRDLVYHGFLANQKRGPGQLPMEHLIIDKLRKAGQLYLSLVAVVGENMVVGYCAFSKIYMAETFCNWYGLGPIAVLPEFRHHGIGSALVKKGIEIMKTEKGADGLVVIGNPDFFGRFGFAAHPKINPVKPTTQNMLALPMKSIIPVGCVSYDKSFDVF